MVSIVALEVRVTEKEYRKRLRKRGMKSMRERERESKM